MKCVFIFNQNNKKIVQNKNYIEKRLSEKFECFSFGAKTKEQFLALLKFSAKHFDYIIFCGGDGTLNAVANEVMTQKRKIVLGYIPSGTVNDFAKSNGFSKNIKKSLDRILNLNEKQVDAFSVNNKFGVYVCGFGIFTSSSHQTNQKKKKVLGKLAYFFDSAKEVFSAKPTPVLVDGQKQNAMLCLLVNSKSVAGFRFNKSADLSDGKMDLVFISEKKNKLSLKTLFLIFKLFLFGTKSVRKNKNITIKSFEQIKIDFLKPTTLNVDGENFGKQNITLRVVKNALTFL